MKNTDPRGPLRTVVKVEPTPKITRITFDCGHVGQFAQHFTYRVGSQMRCIRCIKRRAKNGES
jgi:hypothetical protein